VQRTLTQAGDASPEVVWRRYADLDEWPRWAPFIQAADGSGRELAAGDLHRLDEGCPARPLVEVGIALPDLLW